jgi:hypothetical protein
VPESLVDGTEYTVPWPQGDAASFNVRQRTTYQGLHRLQWKTGDVKSRILDMQPSFTTLFEESHLRPTAPHRGESPTRKGIEIPVVFFPIYAPLLLLAAAIAFSVGHVLPWKQRIDERKFIDKMKSARRFMKWNDFKQAMEKNEGTAIGEYLSMKGPFRLWWTPENIPTTSPYRCDRENHVAFLEEEFAPFFEWSYGRFTHPQRGLARIVEVPEEERKDLKKTLTGARFVSACSFRSIRARSESKSTISA